MPPGQFFIARLRLGIGLNRYQRVRQFGRQFLRERPKEALQGGDVFRGCHVGEVTDKRGDCEGIVGL
ncbi:hypothetical protein D3C83_186360 [compost metagenome]